MVLNGAGLREAREKQNITLLQVEDATKINRRYLEALEADDFQELPGSVYAVGFLKNYARFLGFGPAEIDLMVSQMKEKMGGSPNAAKPAAKNNNNGKRRTNLPGRSLFQWSDWRLWAGGLLIVGAIFASIFAYKALETNGTPEPAVPMPFSEGSGELPTGDSPPSLAIPENPGADPVPAAPLAVEDPVNLKLIVQRDECWIRIVADSKEVLNAILKAGDSREFNAQESIQVHLGNAGTVEFFQNGQSIGYLGKWGQVVKREFRE